MTAKRRGDEQVSVLEAYFVGLGLPEMAARILCAATQLFAAKGYAATSVRDIVQEAKVTNPMLYYYFDNKEGLFHKLIALIFGGFEERITAVLDDDTLSFRGTLEQLVELHFEGVQEAPEVLSFVFSLLFGPRASRPAFDPVRQRQETVGKMQGVFMRAQERGEISFRAGMSVEFLTAQFLGMINQRLMYALKMMEALDHQGTDCVAFMGDVSREDLIEGLIGERARARLLTFFLAGAGTLHEASEQECEEDGCNEEE